MMCKNTINFEISQGGIVNMLDIKMFLYLCALCYDVNEDDFR